MQPTPGWYDDPHHPAQLRWWDGNTWTPQAMPRPAAATVPGSAGPIPPGSAPYGAAPGHPGYPPAGFGPTPTRSFGARNMYSLLAAGVSVLYGVLAIFAHFVFLGIFPVLLTVYAFRAKEPYAVVALVFAVAAIGLSVYMLAR